jgi:hypothetical protein
MKVALTVIATLGTFGFFYFSWTLLKSYLIVRGAPRQDMFICPKGHGPLPKSSLINFLGEDYCSICFHQNIKKAEKGQL